TAPLRYRPRRLSPANPPYIVWLVFARRGKGLHSRSGHPRTYPHHHFLSVRTSLLFETANLLMLTNGTSTSTMCHSREHLVQGVTSRGSGGILQAHCTAAAIFSARIWRVVTQSICRGGWPSNRTAACGMFLTLPTLRPEIPLAW